MIKEELIRIQPENRVAVFKITWHRPQEKGENRAFHSKWAYYQTMCYWVYDFVSIVMDTERGDCQRWIAHQNKALTSGLLLPYNLLILEYVKEKKRNDPGRLSDEERSRVHNTAYSYDTRRIEWVWSCSQQGIKCDSKRARMKSDLFLVSWQSEELTELGSSWLSFNRDVGQIKRVKSVDWHALRIKRRAGWLRGLCQIGFCQ